MKNRHMMAVLIALYLVVALSGAASADILFFQVDSPSSGTVWNPGNTYKIHWYTKDTSGANFPSTWVRLLLFPEGQPAGATLIGEFPINTDSTDIGWQVPPNTAAGTYVIRVQAKDTVKYPNKFGDSAPFHINKPVTQVVTPGQPGWVPPSGSVTGGPITAANETVVQKKESAGAKKYIGRVIDLSGQWKSSIGSVYNITQKGNQFEWTVASTNEKAQGTVQGSAVSASWKGPQSSGSATGQITKVDAAGKATQIDWKNGVTFSR